MYVGSGNRNYALIIWPRVVEGSCGGGGVGFVHIKNLRDDKKHRQACGTKNVIGWIEFLDLDSSGLLW